MNNDLDAVQSGYREAKEVIEPAYKALKKLLELLSMSVAAIKERLMKSLEKSPDDFMKEVTEMQTKIKDEYNSQEKTAINNGQPQLANELREAMNALENDISVKRVEIVGLKENGQDYSEKLDGLAQDLHAMGTITTELEKGNKDLDYSKTAENVREALEETPIDTSKLQLFANEKDKSNQKGTKENSKSQSLNEKFQNAVKEATKTNAENVKTQVQNVTKDIGERSL